MHTSIFSRLFATALVAACLLLGTGTGYAAEDRLTVTQDESSMEQVIEKMSKRGKFPVDIADALNHLGYVTPRGKRFNKYNMTYLMKSLEPVS